MEQPKNDVLRIELTDEQKKKLQEKTGQQVEAVEFDVKELENRIAPRSFVDL